MTIGTLGRDGNAASKARKKRSTFKTSRLRLTNLGRLEQAGGRGAMNGGH
jgi:hypothetical protein